jgi:hypothetical protein
MTTRPEPKYRPPTWREVVDLSIAEQHDADIPSNVGSIKNMPLNTEPYDLPESVNHSAMDLEKDVEKGSAPESIASKRETEETIEENDPNTVFWDGADDPENPLNWTSFRKWGTVVVVSAITFLTPLASSLFAPGVPEVMETFNSTDQMLEGFMVSVYVLGFAFGPLIIAPLSEMYGRLPLYHSCNLLFIIWTIAAAVAPNMAAFIIFRFFMGCKFR